MVYEQGRGLQGGLGVVPVIYAIVMLDLKWMKWEKVSHNTHAETQPELTAASPKRRPHKQIYGIPFIGRK